MDDRGLRESISTSRIFNSVKLEKNSYRCNIAIEQKYELYSDADFY